MADANQVISRPGLAAVRYPAGLSGWPSARLRRTAGWLVVVMFALTLAFWCARIGATFDPPYLLLALNIVFIGIPSGHVAVSGVLGFLRAGTWALLWLAMGALTFALAVLAGSWALAVAGPNASVTLHNSLALLAAALHALGALSLAGRRAMPPLKKAARPYVALGAGAASLAAVVFLAVASLHGLLPPFFVQRTGGTPLRQMVVFSAALLFGAAGLVFLHGYIRRRAEFLYWYGLGLLLTALGMAALLEQSATGTPLNWTGRIAQMLAGLCLLVAALATLREARARNLSSGEVLAGAFWRHEANLRLLFESIMDAVVVTDRRSVITDWNPAAEQVYGWSAQEVAGRRVEEVLQTTYPAGWDWERVLAALRTAGTWRGEVKQRRRDGSEIAVLATVSHLKNAAGRPVGTVAVNRDITERERAEQQLRQSEEKTRDLIRYAPSGIYEVDFHTGRFRSVNDAMCEILGYSREEMLAMSAFALLDDAGKALFAERIRRTLAGEKVEPPVEYRVIKSDGTPIYAILNTRITYHDGQPDGAFVIAHDITEQRQAAQLLEQRVAERTAELSLANQELTQREAALRSSQEELQTYSRRLVEAIENERRNLARELHDQAGQSLSALKISLGQLRRELEGGQPMEQQTARLDEMGRLIEGVMDDLHRLALNLRPVSLDRYGLLVALQQYLDFYRRQCGLDVQMLAVGLEELRLPAEVETALYRVIQEALTNVVRHAGARRVGVVIERRDDKAIAMVEDDGQGFDVNQALGSGRLGLLGMRERMEMLGGSLTIESTPGCGTTVYAVVPAGR
jgi:PAS domain S-box-containing protein